MQDLIKQYREQLQALENRKQQLSAEKQRLRGRDYFQALRRLDMLEQECLEMACALAWMVKEYGSGPLLERGETAGVQRRRPQKEAACG